VDGEKVLIAPFTSFKAAVINIALCDSTAIESEFKGQRIAIQGELIAALKCDILLRDELIENQSKIILNSADFAKIDSIKIVNLNTELKKEQRKTKIVGAPGIVLIILSLLL
jgi:hypothetical protein